MSSSETSIYTCAIVSFHLTSNAKSTSPLVFCKIARVDSIILDLISAASIILEYERYWCPLGTLNLCHHLGSQDGFASLGHLSNDGQLYICRGVEVLPTSRDSTVSCYWIGALVSRF